MSPAVSPDPRPASQPRHAVDERYGTVIRARDGVALSANLWLPIPATDAPEERFPAILELIPYGKDSWRFNADAARGRWLARRGFAFCRLDVRGTGSSAGVARDEYSADETRDGYDAVEWLAAQPWCNGNVGMWGISYGGFTSIQVAALRPPHLRAIVPIMATDDRYRDDVHYRGGCLTASELSQYAVSQVAMNAMPPDPALWGSDWRAAWLARLEATSPWLFRWLREQRDGSYWRQGSLAPDYDAIEAAILQIGGWMDSYVDPVFRMHERSRAPVRSLVGNWVHGLPDSAYPGPAVDWLHELVRFFDHWLKGIDNGVMDEPAFTWFEREFRDPEPFPAVLDGRWRSSSSPEDAGVAPRAWRFGAGSAPLAGTLVEVAREVEPGGAGADPFPHRATWGTRGGLSWGAGSPPNGLARDLRPDDALVPTYTSAPLAEPLAILGSPVVVVHVSATAPVATLSVRLSDVAPDGTSALVSLGVLNLTHRRSDAAPEPLEAGRVEEVAIPLRATGYRFRAGHRIRVSIGSGLWPVLWPSPFACELTVRHGAGTPSRLVLPVVPPAGGTTDLPVPQFLTEPPADLETVGAGEEDPPGWRIEEDVLAGTVRVHLHEAGSETLPDGRTLITREAIDLVASDADPARVTLDADVVYRWREREFETEIRARSRQESSAEAFELSVELDVTVDGRPFFSRTWSESVPRDLV